MTSPAKVNRLFWDIETSPNIALTWRAGFKLSIPHDNLLQERAIICICYKWEHEKKVHSLTWDDAQDDREMLEAFIKVATVADEMVAHNGDRFDLPWLRTRCLLHDLPPWPQCKTIDTLQWARRKFYFNSNRLDYIGKFLGMGGKLETNFGMWKSICLQNCRKTLKKMVTYCKRDVAMLQDVYQKLAAHMPAKTHAGVLSGSDKWTSPHNGSTHVQKWKTQVTARGTKQHEMKCVETGRYFTISDRAYRDYRDWRENNPRKDRAA